MFTKKKGVSRDATFYKMKIQGFPGVMYVRSETQATGNAEMPNRIHRAEEEFRRKETSEFGTFETPVLIQLAVITVVKHFAIGKAESRIF